MNNTAPKPRLFSPQGRLSRRAYWGRMALVQLAFVPLGISAATSLPPSDTIMALIWLFLGLMTIPAAPCCLLTLPLILLGSLALCPPGYTPPPASAWDSAAQVASLLGLALLCAYALPRTVRRLRDAGQPRQRVMLGLLPLLGGLVLSYFLFKPTKQS